MKHLFGFLFTVLLASCQADDGVYNEKLSKLDGLLKDKPRQVYDSLSAMSPKTMGPADRAYYSMLYASALDKTYQKPASDSLLENSVKYFTTSGDYYNLSRTQYYLGKYFAEKEVTKSYGLFKQAELNFQKSDRPDLYFYGLVAFQLGYVQYRQFNLAESRHYFEKARNIYVETGDTLAHIFALRQLSLIAMRNKKHVESEDFLEEADGLWSKMHFADKKQQVETAVYILNTRSFLYQVQKKYESELLSAYQTVNMLNSIGVDILSMYYLQLVDAYNGLGQGDSVRHYASLMIAAARKENDIVSQINAYRRLIDVEEGAGNYKEACSLRKIHIELRDSVARKSRTADVLELEKKYDIAEKERLILKEKNRNLFLSLVTLFALFMLLGIWFYYGWVHRRLREENAKLSEKVQQTKWGFALSKVLISDNLSLHDQWDKLLTRNHVNIQNPKFYKEFLELSRSQREDYTNRLFLSLLDIDKNFISRLQECYPTLTVEEVLLSTMIRHRWRLDDIAEVFRVSVDAVRKRKYRLKIKLFGKEENNASVDYYLGNL